MGRTKERLAKALSDRLDTTVNPSEFWTNRNAEMAGCARWGIWVKRDGRDISVCSWDTMTECLKRGFVISFEGSEICVTVDDPG